MGTTDPRDPGGARRRHARRLHASAACCPAAPRRTSCVEQHLDVQMDFDSVQKAGSRLGTGTMIVLDDQTCPVGMVLNLEQFFAQESCGWCTPCREGLPWVAQTPGRARGRAGASRATSRSLGEHTLARCGPGNTFCALAPGAMEPLQSALKYFREDFERHIREKRCPWRVGDGDHLRRQPAVRGQGRAEPAAGLPVAGLQPALLLLAPGAAARWAPAASARSSSSGTRTTRAAASSWPA